MAFPTNENGAPGQGGFGGSTGQGPGHQGESRPEGGIGAKAAPGPSGFQDNRERGAGAFAGHARQSALTQPPERQYSFRALIAMGILGYTLGRLFSR